MPSLTKKKPLRKKGENKNLKDVPKGRIRVILARSITKLGSIGDLVDVTPGYFRNYLFPQGLALIANASSLKKIEEAKKTVLAEEKKIYEDMLVVKKKLEEVDVTLRAKAQEAGLLYGAVQPSHIADALNADGISIEAEKIEILAPIKELGHHDVCYNLHPKITLKAKIWVVEE